MEHDRCHIRMNPDISNAQYHDGVITGGHPVLDLTLQPHAGASDEDRTGRRRLRFQSGETVTAFGCQGAYSLVMALSEDADSQRRQFLKLWPGRLGVLNAKRHQWRVQRDRHKRTDGHTQPLARRLGGNRDYTGREVAECRP